MICTPTPGDGIWRIEKIWGESAMRLGTVTVLCLLMTDVAWAQDSKEGRSLKDLRPQVDPDRFQPRPPPLPPRSSGGNLGKLFDGWDLRIGHGSGGAKGCGGFRTTPDDFDCGRPDPVR